jgi:hypothetical protein
MIFLWALALGIICPPTAMFLSMASFEIGDNGNGEICITGIDLFIIMGAGIAFIFTPLIGIVGYVIEKITLKKYKSIRF